MTAGLLASAGPVGEAFAQTPPSERELRIYAGLHDAAARGDVAEIEQLIAEGEKPNLQDCKSRTPLHVAVFMRKNAQRARSCGLAPTPTRSMPSATTSSPSPR